MEHLAKALFVVGHPSTRAHVATLAHLYLITAVRRLSFLSASSSMGTYNSRNTCFKGCTNASRTVGSAMPPTCPMRANDRGARWLAACRGRWFVRHPAYATYHQHTVLCVGAAAQAALANSGATMGLASITAASAGMMVVCWRIMSSKISRALRYCSVHSLCVWFTSR